jgi:glucan-binding YG repeat protein
MRKNYKRLIGTVCGTVVLCSAIGFTAFADKSEGFKEDGIPIATESTASPNITAPESGTEVTGGQQENATSDAKSGEAKPKETETETTVPEENVLDNKTLKDKQFPAYANGNINAGLLEETPKFIPVTNPHWVSDQPGVATWDELETEQQQNVKGVFLVIYKDGKKIAQRNANVGYASSLKLLESFEGEGSYQFKAVYRMTDQYDGEEDYLSDLSDSFEYTLSGKTMPIPTGFHWNKDGSVTWDPINISDLPGWDTNSFITYSVSFYEGDAAKPWDTWFMNSAPSISQILKMQPGKTYRFRISASGDGLNYNNSELSDYSESFVMPVSESTVKVKLDALNQVGDAKLSATIKNLTLTDDERETMKATIQNSESAAEQLKELENRYKAANGKEFTVQAESNIVDSSQINIAGAVLNDASKIIFTPTQSADNSLSQYRNQVSMNISLDTNELKFPVLITMPVPSNMNVEKVKIYHYHESGSTEIIIPRIFVDNGVKKVEFAVSGFSVFTFVDTSSANTSSGGSSSGGSSSGGGGGMTSSKTTSGVPSSAPALTGIWVKNETGWWLEKTDKSYPKNQWAKINNTVYRFNESGYMVEGWFVLNGKWYYLTPSSGAMSTGWVDIQNRWYYLNNDGSMAVGWIKLADKWYYLNADGKMAANTVTPDGYHVDENGVWIQ